jgi:hypothetical protein
MAQSTRSKTSALGNSTVDEDIDESLSYHSRSSRKDSNFTSIREKDSDSEYFPSIVNHDFGLLYPISSKALKLRHFNQVNSISLKVFKNPSDISIWLDAFYAQSLLINMHEYFSGQVCFHLHPACDAMFHLKSSSSTSPFHMKIVEENIIFLEYTSPTSIVQSSSLPFYSTHRKNYRLCNKETVGSG